MSVHPDSYGLATAALKQLDGDRYIASLVLPEPARAHIQALWAFAAELAAVRGRVTEPAPGEIRLQWWADALEGTEHGAVRANPVADALFDTIETFGLSTVPLMRMVNARRFDLYDDPMPDLGQAEGYAGETASILYHYAAMILNGGREPQSGDAAGHLGVADSLSLHLRAMPADLAAGRLMLPHDLLTRHGVTESQLFAGSMTEGLGDALAELRSIATDHLEEARTAIVLLPREIRPAFAAIALIDKRLKALERHRQTPFALYPAGADWRKIAAVLFWAMKSQK
ncbi:phytoene/squalene synthase family protein [Cucumibacter marinus]|uniref:phytoene/squalene synthase family protein n=1 Tax=Cucumibacter marinus TaxID=1121252 RepID=UPI000406CA73|nr:squalene/phytoene synthase family protein [Cucumibacter marinus]